MPAAAQSRRSDLPSQIRFDRISGETKGSSPPGTGFEFRLAEQGAVTLWLAGVPRGLPPRRLAVFWQALPHQVLPGPRQEGWRMIVPLDWVLRREIPPALVAHLIEGQLLFEPDGDQFNSERERMLRWTADLESREPARLRALELEVEARLFRLSQALPLKRPTAPFAVGAKGPKDKVQRTAAFIAKHFTSPLTTVELGRATGLHPVYLNSLFRRQMGFTPFEFLLRLRLAQALRMLLTTRESVAVVAAGSGFGSMRRLHAVFRERLGETPLGFRKRHPFLPRIHARPAPERPETA